MHAVLCAAGYNLRWLLRAIARLGLTAFYALAALLVAANVLGQSHAPPSRFTVSVLRWTQILLCWSN